MTTPTPPDDVDLNEEALYSHGQRITEGDAQRALEAFEDDETPLDPGKVLHPRTT